MSMEESASPKHYALLIGINAYSKHDSLRGCVNDVESIKSVLDNQDSPIVHSQVLTATVSPTGGIVEAEEDRPTYENVVKALLDIREKANKGDCVYIHYSGHGTRIPPASKNEEHESNVYEGYLALCLLADGKVGQVKELWGRQFAVQLGRMVDKGIAVTVVLDCCFSGAVWRKEEDEAIENDPTIRYRPYKHDTTDGPGVETCPNASVYRQIDMSPSWLIKAEGYVILAACGPHEKAGEFQPEPQGVFFGRLSHCLYEIFLQNGFSGKHRHIFHSLRLKFHGNLSSKSDVGSESKATDAPTYQSTRKTQTPILYGNADQNFLGKPPAVKGRGPNYLDRGIMLVEKQNGDGALILHAGQAHGLNTGDEVQIFTLLLSKGSSSPLSDPVTATICQAGGLTSTLALASSNTCGDGQWSAELHLSHRLQDFPVYLSPDVRHMAGLHEGLSRHSIYAHEQEDQAYVFCLGLDKGGPQNMSIFIILDRQGNKIKNLPPLAFSCTNIENVCTILAHLAKFMLVKELKNCDSDAAHGEKDNLDFLQSFDLYVTNRCGVRYNPDEVLEVHEAELTRKTFTFQLHFINRGNSTLFAYVYALGPHWDVSHVHFASFDIVPSMAAALDGEAFKPRISKGLRTTIPKDLCDDVLFVDDVLKVFVTSRPTAFDILEQPSIGDSLSGRAKQQYRKAPDLGDLSSTEEWDAFNFPIRTILKK